MFLSIECKKIWETAGRLSMILSTNDQLADILTDPLTMQQFLTLKSKLNMIPALNLSGVLKDRASTL